MAAAAPVVRADQPALAVKGTLIVDLRPDVTADAKSWENHAAAKDGVGNFTPVNAKPIETVSTDSPAGKINAVKLDGDAAKVLLSEKPVPDSVCSGGSASVEAWINVSQLDDHATVIAYGPRDQGQQRQFLYGNVKPFSGFFADIDDWNGYTPTANEWHLVDWTYDSDKKVLIVYVDSKQVCSKSLDLNTGATVVAIGAGNTEEDHKTFTCDPMTGLVASMRVMSGVLTADDVKQDYLAGGGKPAAAK